MKKTITWLSMFTAAGIMIACSNSNTNSGGADSASADSHAVHDTASAPVSDKAFAAISATKSDTSGNGRAEFSRNEDGTVQLTLNVSFPKMAGKTVAAHLHEHGDCGDAGKEAHGHWNPTNEPHGKWNEGQHHSGDIGNIQLDSKGEGSISLSTDRWTIGGPEQTNILNRAVIVHSGVDDYKTQPTGNAGSRIGCGVISAQ